LKAEENVKCFLYLLYSAAGCIWPPWHIVPVGTNRRNAVRHKKQSCISSV